MENTVATGFTTLLGYVSEAFTSFAGMITSVGSEIMKSEILVLFLIIPLIGIGVGLFKRLLNVN